MLIRSYMKRTRTLAGFELHHESRLHKGIQALQKGQWNAVLLDLGLPESVGLDTLRIVRSIAVDVPIIVLTGLDDEEVAFSAAKHGAHDFIEKSQLSGPLLARSLRYAQERHQLLSELHDRATHDRLTGLANRDYFDGQVEEAVSQSGFGSDKHCLMLLDLDGFKKVNDLYGHDVGDQLLILVTARFQNCLRPNDRLARLGGDEFGILLEGVSTPEQSNVVAERLHASLRPPCQIGANFHSISSSIGIVFSTDTQRGTPAFTRRELMRNADMAMYAAKAQGPGHSRYFDREIRESMVEQTTLEEQLKTAISDGDISLHFQPIVDLETEKTVGFEALCRWNPAGGKFIPPDVFIPIAERTELIKPIGNWVIRKACESFAEWKSARLDAGQEAATVHVNVSPVQLSDDELIPTIKAAIFDYGLEASELTLEITESALRLDVDHAAQVLSQIRKIGVGLSIDDFGTGYSSLGQLRRLPFTGLKIDRTFIAQLDDPSGEPAIFLEAITSFAASLHLKTVAEGIETAAQADHVRQVGCKYAQGYFFGRPAPMTELMQAERETAQLALC